jgi:hypothetical protein
MSTDALTYLRSTLNAATKRAEAAASLCGCHPPAPSWSFDDEETDGRIVVDNEPHPRTRRKIGRRWNGSYEGLFMAEHIVANDPAAVVRRIAADRKILADCDDVLHDFTSGALRQLAVDTIRSLAEGWGWTGGAS